MTKKQAPRFNNVEFIRAELNEGHLADLRKRKGQLIEEMWDRFDDLVRDGYRITVKFDSYSNSPSCFIQHQDEDHENGQRILTGRGRSIQSAMLEAFYKHFVIFDGVWPAASFKGKPILWDD